ncbi:MAG TPA: hypothetical protein VF131_17155 [Blastocatellia bacterium]|nr:hypothetical protein [Blastocatellia bacterium]
MWWTSLVVSLLAALFLVSSGVASDQPINTESWVEDFAQLKQEMAAHYANLQWAIESRGLDLKQLSERTESRLRATRSDNDARQVIESFLNARLCALPPGRVERGRGNYPG